MELAAWSPGCSSQLLDSSPPRPTGGEALLSPIPRPGSRNPARNSGFMVRQLLISAANQGKSGAASRLLMGVQNEQPFTGFDCGLRGEKDGRRLPGGRLSRHDCRVCPDLLVARILPVKGSGALPNREDSRISTRRPGEGPIVPSQGMTTTFRVIAFPAASKRAQYMPPPTSVPSSARPSQVSWCSPAGRTWSRSDRTTRPETS